MDANKKVLVVDDDKMLNDLLVREIRSAGFIVDSAAGGQEALSKVLISKPDVILLDVLMPGIDGITVLKKLKSDPKTEDVKIIILTNASDNEKIDEVLKTGGAGYLLKVYQTPDTVIEAIKNLI